MQLKNEAFDINHRLNTGLRYHQEGRLDEAERNYRSILDHEPDQPDTLHLLGVLMQARGERDPAEKFIRKAICLNPQNPFFYCSLGDIFSDCKEYEAAVRNYQKALQLKPDLVEALFNLGNALKARGQFTDAIKTYKQALALKPDLHQAHFNMAGACQRQGDLDQALVCYQNTVDLKPDNAVAWNHLGRLLQKMGELERAASCYQQALNLKPDYPEALYHKGNIHQVQNEIDEALDCFQKAFALQPHHVGLINNIGLIYYSQSRFADAVDWFRKAVVLEPENHNIHNNLGAAYHKLGKLTEAIGCYQKTVQLVPNDGDAYNNMAVAHKDRGDITEAIEAHRKALMHNPNYHSAHSNLLLAMHYDLNSDSQTIFTESQDWWQQHGAPVADSRIHNNNPDPERPLNIGYVSADFRQHSVSYFFLPLLTAHDRRNVSVFCYSGVSYPDHMTEKIKNATDHWRSIVGMSPEAVAEQIEKDGIDILVDLSGHTAGHRLLTFARKPAPVQVTWLGYPNTTGISVMDYRFSDAIADPPGKSDNHHSETVIRLSNGFLCYRPPDAVPEVDHLPAAGTGRITFGSFNTLPKINPHVIAVWSEILQRISGSRLYLKCKQLADESTRLLFLEKFSAHGVSSDRITLLPQTPTTQEHLGLYNDIDIGLDPFPYNGTTTTFEALWMGVPVVTLKGDRHSGRVGASILRRLDLDRELIAATQQEYVDLAVALSGDIPRLERMRKELRTRMAHSALCDASGFTEQVETSFRAMWRKWCENNGPHHSGENVLSSPGNHPESDPGRKDCDRPGNCGHVENRSSLAEALSLLQSGKVDQAETVCIKILDRSPGDSDAMHLWGIIANQKNDPVRAEELIQKAIQLNPGNPLFYCSLADILQTTMKFETALLYYKKAVDLNPDFFEAMFNMGNTYHRLGNFEKAAESFQNAIELKPGFVDGLNNLGKALQDSGRLQQAIGYYQEAVKLDPDFAVAHFNMGSALNENNEYSEAIVHFQKALSLRPDHAPTYNSIGRAYHALGQLEAALSWYQKALNIDPEYSFAINNIGKVYDDEGLFDEAYSWYQKAVNMDPGMADARFNSALIHLRRGAFAEGWLEYEWRFQRKNRRHIYPHRFDIPRWQGEEFTGKTLLVHCEQGFGDVLQFIRYLPLVKARGGTVVFEVQKELAGLFSHFACIDDLLEYSTQAKPAGNFDYYIPLLSLAGVFRTDMNSIPQTVPYISADPNKVGYWRQRICGPGFKIGLVWSGKSTNPKRSCDIQDLMPVLETPGVLFYGLQKGRAAEQVDLLPPGIEVVNLGPDFNDFTDTAAAIDNLDLVISIDTAVAHLAGAMGKPVWLLLPYVGDWRWMQAGDKSPWYPTMRLFRQPKLGGWDSVCKKIGSELKTLSTSL